MSTDDLTVEELENLKLAQTTVLRTFPDGLSAKQVLRAIAQLQRLTARRCETCQHTLGVQRPDWGIQLCGLMGKEASRDAVGVVRDKTNFGTWDVPLTVNGQPFSCAAWTEKPKEMK
jgi:hypothetical protein